MVTPCLDIDLEFGIFFCEAENCIKYIFYDEYMAVISLFWHWHHIYHSKTSIWLFKYCSGILIYYEHLLVQFTLALLNEGLWKQLLSIALFEVNAIDISCVNKCVNITLSQMCREGINFFRELIWWGNGNIPRDIGQYYGCWCPGSLRHRGLDFNIKMLSYQYRKSHCRDKTVIRSSYLHKRIFNTGKIISLYSIRAQVTNNHMIIGWSGTGLSDAIRGKCVFPMVQPKAYAIWFD